MKFNWDKYRMLVKNNPKRAEEYIKECQKRDTVLEIEAPQEETAIEGTNTLEQLQKLYVEKFGKQLSFKYQNDVEWIKAKLAE